MKKIVKIITIFILFNISCFYDEMSPQKDYYSQEGRELSFSSDFEKICAENDGLLLTELTDDSGNSIFDIWNDPLYFSSSLRCASSPVGNAYSSATSGGNTIIPMNILSSSFLGADININFTCNHNNSVSVPGENKIIIGIGAGENAESGDYGIKGIISCYYASSTSYGRISVSVGETEYGDNTYEGLSTSATYGLNLHINPSPDNYYEVYLSITDPSTNEILLDLTTSISQADVTMKKGLGFGIVPDTGNYRTYLIYYVYAHILLY